MSTRTSVLSLIINESTSMLHGPITPSTLYAADL